MKLSKHHKKVMKHLSSKEQSILRDTVRRRQGNDGRGLRKKMAHLLALGVCIGGLIAATAGPAQAAEISRDVSAPSLFNQANADERAGRFGSAILEYERAKMLAPHDSAIDQNLHVAREKAGVSAPAIPAWFKPAYWLGFDGLAVVAAGSLFLICCFYFGGGLIPIGSRVHARRVTLSLIAFWGLLVTVIALRWPELNRAVVRDMPATAHIAPAASSSSVFELKPGDVVTVTRDYGDFVMVRTLDNRFGWVGKREVAPIIPGRADRSAMRAPPALRYHF